MSSGRAIEVTGGRNLVIRTVQRDRDVQQFYFDGVTKTIKSVKYNDRSFDIQNAGRSSNLQIWKTNARWFQLFRYQNSYIFNERGKHVEVQSNRDVENQNVALGNKNGGLNQQWEVVYADELVIEYKKGELNPDFGLYVEREFSVLTKMQSGRYMDVINHSVVIKTRNGNSSQKWYFDQKTKTVKSVMNKNKSWNIHNNGQNRDLSIHKTSGQWFQLFRYENEFFINQRGLVLTVENNRDVEGGNVITWKRAGGRNQRW